MTLKPALYLIPVNISDAPLCDTLPAGNTEIISGIKHFIVENVRTARRFLKKCNRDIDISQLTFSELNNHTDPNDISLMLDPLRNGEPVGVMSEAGCPAVADPGSQVVEIAQREGLRVIPLVGPSSILMSLMASGFNGQGFCFNGYLPIDNADKARQIRRMEEEARTRHITQIFIETPYRNNRLIEFLASSLRPDTLLCVASLITDPEHENIVTRTAAQWRTAHYDYNKRPTIFLIHRK